MAFLEELAKVLGTGFQEQYNVKQYGPDYAQQWAAAPQAEIARLLQVAEAGQRLQQVLARNQTEEGLAAKMFPGMDPAQALKLYRMSTAEEDRRLKVQQEESEAELRRASASAATARAADMPAEEARRQREHEATMRMRQEELGLRRQEAGATMGLRDVQTRRERAELEHFQETGYLPGRESAAQGPSERLYSPIDTDKILQAASDMASAEAPVDPKTGTRRPPTRAEVAAIYKALLAEEEGRRLAVRDKATNVIQKRRGAGPETKTGTGDLPGTGPPCPPGVGDGASIRSKTTGRVGTCRGGRLVIQQQ